MRKIFFYPVTIILFLIIQIILPGYIEIKNVSPDIFLIGLIYFALMKGSVTGTSFGFFSGLVQDVFVIGPFGANALTRTLIGFSVGLFQKKLDENNRITQAALVFFLSFFDYWIMYFLRFLFGQPHFPGSILSSFIYSAYNGIISPVIFMLLVIWENLWRRKNNVAG